MSKKKIVEFSLGSKFYFERGNYYYSKNNLDKALDFYRRAIDVDPANPANIFNLACLLSDLEQYTEANRLFRRLLDMDCDFNESFYWLAMNYGQQQHFDKAYEYLRRYLELEPEGEYSESARHILSTVNLERALSIEEEGGNAQRLCNKGIDLINSGKLYSAINCFQRASEEEPDLIAPKNNLALSWFYVGKLDKAMDVCREVLKIEPDNVYANCNLAMFYYSQDDQINCRRQLSSLTRLASEDPDEVIKLGTTFGLLGYHRQALDRFRWLLDNGYDSSFEVLLLAGVAAWNNGLQQAATDLFARMNRLEPENPYGQYAHIPHQPWKPLPYHLRLPQPVLHRLLERKVRPGDWQQLESDYTLWRQLVWMMVNGNVSTRRRLASNVAGSGSKILPERLALLMWNKKLPYSVRRDFYLALRKHDIRPQTNAQLPLADCSDNARRVLHQAMARMEQRQTGFGPLSRAVAVWDSYCETRKPVIRNVPLWSLALEIFVCNNLEDLDQLSAKAGIPAARVRRAVKMLTGVCLNS